MTTNERDMYLDLLARVLTADLYDESAWLALNVSHWKGVLNIAKNAVVRLLATQRLALVRCDPFNPEASSQGTRWPLFGYSMMGLERMRNLRECVETVVREGVPGDLMEAGVWRGGGCIYMAAILKTLDVIDRTVWVADSFEGLPKPGGRSGMREADLSDHPYLEVSEEEVRANFARFGLLDADRVRFLKGWFKDTMPTAPVGSLAVLRLDGDLYESTIDVLRPMYPKVSPGGFVVVDDYFSWPGCRKAVDEYREANGIVAEMKRIDWTGAYWRK